MSAESLAIHGGPAVRSTILPYGRQIIDDDDVAAVVEALRSDRITGGQYVTAFEAALADYVGTACAVAVSSGTAALHAAMYASGVGKDDEVIVPSITFVATANAVVFQGAKPIFADVDESTLLIDPADVERKIAGRTRAIVAVDYAGQPCDYDALRSIADEHGIALLADGCHALGGKDHDVKVGALADLTTFSFHPVKHLTTGEGGMMTTNDSEMAERMRRFRNHCISIDERERSQRGSHFYEITDLGTNYRITDIQCALGLSQLRKLPRWVQRRQEIAARYCEALAEIEGIELLSVRRNVEHAYHLFVVRVAQDRDGFMDALRAEGIGTTVHYIPVHLHPLYRERFGTGPGMCPVAEAAYERIVTLPLFAGMTDEDVENVITAVKKVAACCFA